MGRVLQQLDRTAHSRHQALSIPRARAKGTPQCAPLRHHDPDAPSRPALAALAIAFTVTACGGGSETAEPEQDAATTTRPVATTEVPTTTTTSTIPPPPPLPEDPNIVFHTTPDVTADDIERVRHGVAAARAYLDDRDRPIDVYIAREPVDAFEDQYIAALQRPGMVKGQLVNELAHRNVGLSTRDGRGTVFIAGSQVLKEYNYVSAFVTSAHEAIHTYQEYAARWRDMGPLWMTEGQGTLLAFQLADERRVPSALGDTWEDMRAERYMPRALAEKRPLWELDTEEVWTQGASDTVYGKATMAAEWLEHHSSREALNRTYWEALATMSWQDAFVHAFGLPVEDFYVRFAEWEAAGYPVLDRAGAGHDTGVRTWTKPGDDYWPRS